MTLEDIRNKLDTIDQEIVTLLDQRAKLGRQVGKIKRELNLPLHHPEREKEVLRRIAELSDASFPSQGLKRIYRVIMAETLALQKENDSGCPNCSKHSREGMRDIQAVIAENVAITPGYYRMKLIAPELAGGFHPGQFFQLRLGSRNSGFFLRRPFAPSEYCADGFAFVYAVVGDGTRHLTSLAAGERVGVLAPLGHGYTLAGKGETAVLFGGGCGAPSLTPLAERLSDEGVTVITVLGAKNASTLLEGGAFARCGRLQTATDDGSSGVHGTVVDAFMKEFGESLSAGTRFYACGPIPMLRAVAKLAEAEGVGCEVSLEQRMACGFGACMGCAVAIRDGKGGSAYRRVCHEGPVFNAVDLAWDEIA